MRNQWLRVLLLRCRTPSQPHISQVHHFRSLTSSLLHARAAQPTPNPFSLRRRFTSSPDFAVEPPKPPSDQAVLLAEIFSKQGISNEEIKNELDVKNVVVTHDLILSVLGKPDIDPDLARRVFDWVSESASEKLSSKSYNFMLGILGSNGFVKETWELIGVMKKKGYGVKKGALNRISERFLKDGHGEEVEKLKDLYAKGSAGGGNAESSDYLRVARIIEKQVWGDDVEKQLKELDMEFSSDLVMRVLEVLDVDPNKALILFRWAEESGVFEHNQQSYNALARALSAEYLSQNFWRVVDEMRAKGHEMERDTYFHASQQFFKKKMMKDAVDLYEFAMSGEDKPSVKDSTMLLKKLVASEELDMDLFLKVLEVFKVNEFALTGNILNGVVKSLTSAGRINECNRMLKALNKAGYEPSESSLGNMAFKLSSFGEMRHARVFMDKMPPSSDYTTWVSLVKGFCEKGNLDGAYLAVQKMVKKLGPSCGGRPLDLLIETYCEKGRPLRAFKLVAKMVIDNGVRPWQSTYKTLTRKLLARKHFVEALDVMTMMQSQGYAADLDSFVAYLSKKGSAEDAVTFLHDMTKKRSAPTPVYLRLFEAYLSAGRQGEAHDLLSKCPRHVKNDADVLDLFASKSSAAAKTDEAVAA